MKRTWFVCVLSGAALLGALYLFAGQKKQHTDVVTACVAFHFAQKFVNYPDSPAVRACVARVTVLTFRKQNLLFSVRYSNELFPTVLKISDAAFGNGMHPIAPLIPFEMMNTSSAANYNKPNSLMQHCGGGRRGYSS